MNRIKDYNNKKDALLIELEKQNVNLMEYLNGKTFDIIINKKKYKIFQIMSTNALKSKIKNLTKEKLKIEIIKKHEKKNKPIDRVIGGYKIINTEIDTEIDTLYNFVIQNYKVIKTLEEQGFVDMVFDGINFKTAPNKVGRPTEKEKEIRLNLRITEEQHKKLKTYAIEKNVSISEAFRQILDTI